jgi:hypothetical protein
VRKLDVRLCKECKVPESFSEGHAWLNNGDIVHSANHHARMGFIECENLDPLFKNVGDLIGMPIDKLIINITSRGTRLYLEQAFPEDMLKMLHEKTMDNKPFTDATIALCEIMGFGKYEFGDYRHENDADDFSILRIMKPFSVPEAAGAFSGATSTFAGGEHSITYEEISPGLFEFTSRWTKYPEVLKERLPIAQYRPREGDLELERCGTCGCPRAFAAYRWHLDKGVIINTHTGRRMAILGFEMLDSVFQALEAELGDTIPRVVVEAQKDFVKTGFYSIEELSDEGDFRTQLALRGLGNLREIKMGANGLDMRIDNVSGHLMTIGMAQGLFEVAFDLESTVDWELSEEGDLEVAVSPRGISTSPSPVQETRLPESPSRET